MDFDVVTFIMGTIVSGIFCAQVGIVWYALRDLERQRIENLERDADSLPRPRKVA